MILSYEKCLEKYESKYNINKLIAEGKLYRQEKGIYSYDKYVPALEIITAKYPKAIFTLNSAFYYHNLTDVIPDKFFLATPRGAAKIPDKRVKQIFENSDAISLGTETITHNGCDLLIYGKERMLVELLRNKNKLPFDYYKEILLSFRRIIDSVDLAMVQDIAIEMPKSQMIMEALQMEVL